MKTTLVAKVQHMAAADVLALVPSETLTALQSRDTHPEFRAYTVAHEGEAVGNVVGLGQRVTQYMRDMVEKVYDKLTLGTKFFHRHGETNSHDGRTVVGELVGKTVRQVGDKLHDIAVAYIYPEHRDKPLDVASFEADVLLTDEGNGRATAVDVGEITGIALGTSGIDVPGFPGATLLAAAQMFAAQGKETEMTLKEMKEAIKAAGFKPGELFDKTELVADPVIVEHVRTEKQTEVEAKRQIQERLGEKLDKMRADVEAAEGKVVELTGQLTRTNAQAALTSVATERKLTEQQRKFVDRNFSTFKTEAKDEVGLKADLATFLDKQLKEFDEVAKIYGVEPKKTSPNIPTGDQDPTTQTTEEGSDLTDPKNNPFIPK